ncbi:MAG TPA: YraN family protein [Kiritimatiellia bacterium]|nr:YraN family protein [Kiritimatiellia bacterium]HNR93918.1 YraN family protein [Kiritimatiellia bacterium]HNS80803.1 YraN family protein [Kiritimatiellia bacterium]
MIAWLQRLLRRKKSLPEHLKRGLWGEKVAEDALKKKGYAILGRRVRMGKRGELDLVAKQGETLVFVEVKTRAGEQFGRPFGAIKSHKKKMLMNAAKCYLLKLKERPRYFRFDAVEVIGREGAGEPVVRHIESAIKITRKYRIQW